MMAFAMSDTQMCTAEEVYNTSMASCEPCSTVFDQSATVRFELGLVTLDVQVCERISGIVPGFIYPPNDSDYIPEIVFDEGKKDFFEDALYQKIKDLSLEEWKSLTMKRSPGRVAYGTKDIYRKPRCNPPNRATMVEKKTLQIIRHQNHEKDRRHRHWLLQCRANLFCSDFLLIMATETLPELKKRLHHGEEGPQSKDPTAKSPGAKDIGKDEIFLMTLYFMIMHKWIMQALEQRIQWLQKCVQQLVTHILKMHTLPSIHSMIPDDQAWQYLPQTRTRYDEALWSRL